MVTGKIVVLVMQVALLLLSSSILVVGARSTSSCPFDRIYGFGSSPDHSDRLASMFNLPLPEPYSTKSAHAYGASFVSSNSTVMPRWFFLDKGIHPLPFNESLFRQLVSLENLLTPFCFSHDRCLQKLNKALFLFDELGVNDYQHMLSHGTYSILEVSKLVPQVVEAIKGMLEGLIRFGARNLFISGSPPLGCLPTNKFRGCTEEDEVRYDSNKLCNTELNMFATLHNDHLQQALYELRHKYPHIRVVYMDYYKAFFTRRNIRAEALGFNSKRLMELCAGGTDQDQLEDFNDPAKVKQCGVSSSVPSVCSKLEDAAAGCLGDSHRDSSGLANKSARNIFTSPLWQFLL